MAAFGIEQSINGELMNRVGRGAIECMLTFIVGLLLGRLAWTALASFEGYSLVHDINSLQKAHTGELGSDLLLTHINPFASNSVVSSEGLPISLLDLKLAGVRFVATNSEASSAVLALFPVSDCETDRPNCLRRISGSS